MRRKCSGTNKRGEPCGLWAMTEAGFCAVHGGLVDPSELGRKGGRASGRVRSGLGPEVLDDDLRERARSRLRDMLDSPDEKTRLAAARGLFSYGATPPSEGRTPSGGVPASVKAERDMWEQHRQMVDMGLLCGCYSAHDRSALTDDQIRQRIAGLEEELAQRTST
jgi:hypothetical protein